MDVARCHNKRKTLKNLNFLRRPSRCPYFIVLVVFIFLMEALSGGVAMRHKMLISSTVCSQYFQVGLVFGMPTVAIPRLREERGEDYVTQEMASWISSVISYTAFPCVPLLVLLAKYIGRKYTFAVGVACAVVGNILLYAANTPVQVLVGMMMQGVLCAEQLSASLLVLTEYTSPRYRGVFLTFKSATFAWGIWIANIIGTVSDWHNIALFGLACGVYNMISLFIWPESPYWLASKGKFDHCRDAHRWLKGRSLSSEKELQELLETQQQPTTHDDNLLKLNKDRKKTTLRQIWHNIKDKHFYKSLLINAALHGQYHFSGKLVCSVYAIDIIKNITKSKNDAYKGMLILDAVTILGMYIGSALSKKFPRRSLLFWTSGPAIVLLLMLSMYLYLIEFEIIVGNKLVILCLSTGFSLLISGGPMLLATALCAETLPLHLRNACAVSAGLIPCTFLAINLKFAPWIFTNWGMQGAFLLYGITSGTLSVILFVYLPETKNKTLKEIQDLILNMSTKKT